MGATRVSHISDLQRGLVGTELKMLILRDLKKHHVINIILSSLSKVIT